MMFDIFRRTNWETKSMTLTLRHWTAKQSARYVSGLTDLDFEVRNNKIRRTKRSQHRRINTVEMFTQCCSVTRRWWSWCALPSVEHKSQSGAWRTSYPRRARSALGVDIVLTLDVCMFVCLYVCMLALYTENAWSEWLETRNRSTPQQSPEAYWFWA